MHRRYRSVGDKKKKAGTVTQPNPMLGNRQPPEGWPVGSFTTYTQAQAAVDMLSDSENFPVGELTIVGVNLMEVERVTGRLNWGRVLGAGAASGAWMGLLVGLIMAMFSPGIAAPLLSGVLIGALFGMVASAVTYGASRGRRDFTSSREIVAGRYDVLCTAQHARQARDMIARSNLAQHTPQDRA